MNKPKKEDYGWEEPTLGEPGGWCVEGGEDAYLQAYEDYRMYRLEKARGWRNALLTKEEKEWIEELRNLIERQPKSLFLCLVPTERIVVMKFVTGVDKGFYRMNIDGFEHSYIYVDNRWDIHEEDS
jgi:hypothetical protein